MSNESYGNKTGCLYSATDKAIYDALQQHKVTKEDLKDLFFKRGIVISNSTLKERLADSFSMYLHGYEDYDQLSKILGTTSRKERAHSYNIISAEIEQDDVISILGELKNEFSDNNNDIVDFNVTKGTIILKIQYTEPDFTKSEFRQLVDKDAEVIITRINDGFNIIGPYNKKMSEFTDALLSKIESIDPTAKKDEINLTAVTNHSVITSFFDGLTSTMEGYTLYSVTDVFVYNPDDDTGTGTHIKKASLSGTGVTLSSELASLSKKGFYIWKIVWTAVDDRYLNSDIYEFEAQFSEPDSRSEFAFLIRGYYKKKEEGDDTESSDTGHSKNRVNLSKNEEVKFYRLIDKTARSVLAKINGINPVANDDEGDNEDDDVAV
ncbi:hypothetical protein ACSILO_003084 [Yersinia enterocolitica]